MAKPVVTKQKFINQWLRHFAPALTRDQFEEYVKDQHIWHVFSWKLIAYEGLLQGDDARNAFQAADKSSVICCDMSGNCGVQDHLPPQYSTAEKIDVTAGEFYVVAKDYSWTYIKTHEGDSCGPYYLQLL